MTQPTFEEIVRAWTLEYDERLPSDRKERIKAFIVLLGNLQDHGFGKEELNNSKKEKIVRSCVNPNHHNKQKLKKWISLVVNDCIFRDSQDPYGRGYSRNGSPT
jgi:hypothetical protein